MKKVLPMTGSDNTDTHRTSLRALLACALLLLAAFALAGCGELEDISRVEVGMVENSGLNTTEAHFQTLTGRKTWRETVEAGETLILTYDAEVEKGVLTLEVADPQSEVIWELALEAEENAGDEVELVAESGGTYTIAVEGAGAGGSYELSWDVSE